MIRVWFLGATCLFVFGCATPVASSLDQVRVGMDKASVLDLAGNPKRTHRQGSEDLWTYIYFVNGTEHQRDLRFAENRVIDIGSPRKMSAEDIEKEKQVIQDFENLVREKEAQRKPNDKKP